MSTTHTVKFAIPKGSIEDATFKILEQAWQSISGRGRTYRVKLSDPEIEVKVLRPQEIPTYVHEGFYDVGITGKDWVREAKADITTLLDLEYGKVKQVIAVPETFAVEDLTGLIEEFAAKKNHCGYLPNTSRLVLLILNLIRLTKNTLAN